MLVFHSEQSVCFRSQRREVVINTPEESKDAPPVVLSVCGACKVCVEHVNQTDSHIYTSVSPDQSCSPPEPHRVSSGAR